MPESTDAGMSTRPRATRSSQSRFLYSGTLARKHSPEVLVDLARAAPDADVIVVSEGVGANWLEYQARHEEITNLTVLPFPSDNAAARMITERAGAGVAVEPGDSAALVLAAKGSLADPDRRREMGAAGRRFAEATFSSDQVARQLIGIVNR